MTFKAGSRNFNTAFREALHSCKYLALAAAAAALVVQGFTFSQRKDWLYSPDFPLMRSLLLAGEELYPYAQALFALAVALFVFGFLFSKRHAHSKFALPLTRQTIFCARFLAGALCSLVPPVVTALCALAFNAFLPAAGVMHMSFFWRLLGSMSIQALLCYAIAVLACLKAGSWVKALVNGVALLAAPGLALFGVFQMMTVFLPGYGHMSYYINHTWPFYMHNPVSFLTPKLDQLNEYAGTRDWFAGHDFSVDFITPAIALALTGLLFLLCYRAFARYPAENAGQPEIGRRFTRWLAAPLSLGVAAICLAGAASTYGPSALVFRRVPGLLALGIGISVGLYAVLAVAFRLWDKKITRMLPSLLCAALLPLAVAGVCKYGFPGYAGRTPEPAQVRSVAVSYRGLHSLRELDTGFGWYGGYGFEGSGELLLVTDEDIALAMELQQTLAARQREMGKSMIASNQVDIVYMLQDGRRVSRRFWRMDAACFEALLELDRTDEFDEMLRYTLSLPAQIASAGEGADFSTYYTPPLKVEASTPIYLRLPDGKAVWPALSEGRKQELLQTLYEELPAQTPRQRYFPEGQEAMTLCLPLGEDPFYGNDAELKANPYGEIYSNGELTLALYPEQFGKTLAILREAGGDVSQDTAFVRAVGVPARAYLQENTSFDYSPPPAVFYAFNTVVEENLPLFFSASQITGLQSETMDSGIIAGLYQSSTTQTSLAREGYLVWFIRADDSSVCRFVEGTEFQILVK